MQQYFFDGQIRRFITQFARMFSGFQVEFGRNEAGAANTGDTLYRVPIRYGDSTRQVQTILQENSASNMPSTPLMTFYITGLDFDRPRMQNPTYIDNKAIRQREYDPATGIYETTQGNAFMVERYMPAPYKLSINLDIWTSNTNQKMQILEQMLPLFNPSLEIQSTDNFLDWTSLSIVELVSTGWSSRSIPQGTEDPIDISTIKFALPVWLSLPAKVKKLGVVETIIASIFDGSGDLVNAISDSDLLLGTRQYITPYGYQVVLIGNKLQILTRSATVDENNFQLPPPDPVEPSNILWTPIVNMYGVLRPGISVVALTQEDGSQVYGTVSFDPSNDQFLLFSVMPESIPANTMAPVNSVINPRVSGPGQGLPAAAFGQRYLLTESTGSDNGYAQSWAGTVGEILIAYPNDIIQYDGSRWVVSFDGQSSPVNTQYVTNITTEIQYRWTGYDWVKSYQGLYPGGQWSLII
jgi:T4-like virus Myoviridae tail sheath stabiliser